jgi:hypothetical protein
MAKERLDAAILALREENWLPRIAQRLNLTRQATSKWRRVPADRVREVAKITDYPLAFLRPDLYEDMPSKPPKLAKPKARRRNHRAVAHA